MIKFRNKKDDNLYSYKFFITYRLEYTTIFQSSVQTIIDNYIIKNILHEQLDEGDITKIKKTISNKYSSCNIRSLCILFYNNIGKEIIDQNKDKLYVKCFNC